MDLAKGDSIPSRDEEPLIEETDLIKTGRLLEKEYAEINTQLDEIERKLQAVIQKRILISKQYANVAHELIQADITSITSKSETDIISKKEKKAVKTKSVHTLESKKSLNN